MIIMLQIIRQGSKTVEVDDDTDFKMVLVNLFRKFVWDPFSLEQYDIISEASAMKIAFGCAVFLIVLCTYLVCAGKAACCFGYFAGYFKRKDHRQQQYAQGGGHQGGYSGLTVKDM